MAIWDYWKVVPKIKSEPGGALNRLLVGPPRIARRLISKVMEHTFRKSSQMFME